MNNFRNLPREERRYGIADLNVLGRPGSTEKVVIRKRLQAGSLPHSQAPALPRIRMDVVVTILRNVAGDRRGGTFPCLNAESISKIA